VRGGSIIPEQPVVQDTDETPQGPLRLNVYPGPQCDGSLYADDGNTLAYQKGDTVRANFTCQASADHVDIDLSAPAGPYQPWFHAVQLNVFGVSGKVTSVTADSQPMSGWRARLGVVTLPPIKWGESAHHLRISIAPGQH
jgi:alpha-glucosidase